MDRARQAKAWALSSLLVLVAIPIITAFEAAGDGSRNDGSQSDLYGDGSRPGDLVMGNSAAFKKALADHNETGMLIEFFLPWCGHSRRLRPEFVEAAREMGGRTPLFARVDCSTVEGSLICQEYEVMYHPSILYLSRGLAYDYQQRGTAAEIVKYCRRMRQPAVRRVERLVEMAELVEREAVVVAAFVAADGPGPEGFYMTTAENLMDRVRFVAAGQPAILDAFGIEKLPTYMIFRKGDAPRVFDPRAAAAAAAAVGGGGESPAMVFGNWVGEAGTPLVPSLTQENYYSQLGAGKPAMVLFVDDSAASAAAVDQMYKAAGALKETLTLCQINGARYQALAIKLGVPPRLLPAVVIMDIDKEWHHVADPAVAITDASLRALAARHAAGLLRPTLRSAPPARHDTGPVYTLVADAFDHKVADPTKDVLVNFRTTWCGFCNVFAPVFHAVAEAAKNVGTLILYDFDLSLNDPDPRLNVTASPTMILFPAHNKTAVTYRGERSVVAITRFLQEHVSLKFETIGTSELVSPDQAARVRRAAAAAVGRHGAD